MATGPALAAGPVFTETVMHNEVKANEACLVTGRLSVSVTYALERRKMQYNP